MSVRRWLQLTVLSIALAPVAAHAFSGGTLVITDHAMNPAEKGWEKALAKAQKSVLAKSGEGWHLYFVAYLNKAAGAEEVNLVFYDVTKGKHEQVNAFPIGTKADAKILMSDAEITAELGFKAGNKYQVLITRLIGGKEVVYAKASLELK